MFIQPIFLLWLAIVPAFMSTAAPLTRRNPEICSGIKTCSDCATRHCVSHGKGGSLTNDRKKCHGITAPEEPGQPTASQKAQAAIKFRAISSHVLEGEAKSSSGRHLTSAWLSNHASDAQSLPLTTPLKTLWVDNDIPEDASKGNKAPKAKFNGKIHEGDRNADLH
ncbi:hypothetical protein FOMPIDRAFT_112924 [Fomitopsis schrenkii]|uniref:Uncharacterized protein n=1 Tax=Fomitopsis schrenkii TaxID=2126942 RepID=S8EWZ6_FOMSC|nr:hypothetical protein FOMPIDRAFT_112924 [Fomitopsis schrenkii]